MTIIATRDLTKIYQTYEKEQGIRGSLRNLFLRRYTDNRAVDDGDLFSGGDPL